MACSRYLSLNPRRPGALATAGVYEGITGLLEVCESESTKAEAAGAPATARVSEGIIGLLEVTESGSPSLPNSLHSSGSFLGSSTSACARVSRAACAFASARVCLVASSSAEFAAVAHAHTSILHGARNSWSDMGRVKGPTGKEFQRWGFRSGRRFASCLRGGGRGKFSAGRRCTGAGCRFTSREATRHRYQDKQGKCGHTFPPPGGS